MASQTEEIEARKKANGGYVHGEAFMLMNYQCEKNRAHVEVLWNSRDGVTPFMIGCRFCDSVAQHVVWNMDRRAVNYKPPAGSRIFVDLSEERAGETAKGYVEKYWSKQMQETFDGKSKEEVIQFFIKEWLKDETPDVIEVTEEIERAYREHVG